MGPFLSVTICGSHLNKYKIQKLKPLQNSIFLEQKVASLSRYQVLKNLTRSVTLSSYKIN